MTVTTKLGRNAAHRKAMLRTMVTQLFEHERIQTTLPKAKQLRKVADRMITLAKRDTRGALAKLTGYVRTEREQHKVLTVLATRYANRQGGYTRVLRCGIRRHDAAPMAFIELVDRPGELRPARPGTGAAFIPPAARIALQQSSQDSSSSSMSVQQGMQLQQQRSLWSQAYNWSSSSSSKGGGSSLQLGGLPQRVSWWQQPQAQVQRWQQLHALSRSCRAVSSAGAVCGTDPPCTQPSQQQQQRQPWVGPAGAAATSPTDVPYGWWVRSWRAVVQQVQSA